MLIVSDTTPLISLMKVSQLDLLAQLYGKILIPRAVYEELTSNKRFPAEAEQIKNSRFITIIDVKTTLELGLDRGETEAISYAKEMEADYLLMDEVKGRKVAKSLGLNVTGTIGILVTALQWDLITREEIETALETLRDNKIVGKKLVEYVKTELLRT